MTPAQQKPLKEMTQEELAALLRQYDRQIAEVLREIKRPKQNKKGTK